MPQPAQGMTELKEGVVNTAQIIQEVNTWGEQVSSILDIVDEIGSLVIPVMSQEC